MGATLHQWLDHRTGFRKFIEVLLIEHIPGGAKWRYVWGSCLAFVFMLQLVTGVLLMTSYSPSDSTAWSSVYFIQYQMDFGWLIRGLHHFGSQAMVVLLGIHMLQVVIAGAHLPPREVNWWLGLALLGAVLGLSLTGYLLPWDQKGYWATQVATNIAGNLPVLGPFMQKVIVGGPVYGHHTLTRFYTLHVAILPPLIIALIIAHLYVFRRHGVTTPANAKGEGWFWPDQAFRDMVVSMLIFGVLLGLVVWGDGHKIETPGQIAAQDGLSGDSPAPERSLWDRIAHAGRDGRGANLDAPADPSKAYPARPEWYFLFLFQLLKYFEGDQEMIGTVVIPQAATLLLLILPLLGIGKMRKFGHAFGIAVIVGLLGSVGVLTFQALAQDRADTDSARKFREDKEQAERLAGRAIELAGNGIPAEGAVLLLQRDPLTRGSELFGQHCAACHNCGSQFAKDSASASELEGFGTKEWVAGLLRTPVSPAYFGHTKLKEMSGWVKRTRAKAKKDGKEAELDVEFEQVAQWLGSHPRGAAPDKADQSPLAKGYRVFENRCSECHTYKQPASEAGKGPDFTGYGDAEWLRMMILAPYQPLRYGEKNQMPAFRNLEGPGGEIVRMEVSEKNPSTKLTQLGDVDRELIIRWLLKDYRVVFGGEPISAPPQR
ncbi:MAG TPA: cytochrome b N-terminal domain-containing protein [Gemmataceae bacterium]|nr:cytochrome b N-terminal domain-containing protein [Gemmataceae bacterium]